MGIFSSLSSVSVTGFRECGGAFPKTVQVFDLCPYRRHRSRGVIIILIIAAAIAQSVGHLVAERSLFTIM